MNWSPRWPITIIGKNELQKVEKYHDEKKLQFDCGGEGGICLEMYA